MPGGDLGVHVPAAERQRHEPHAGRHQPPGQQHALSCLVTAVFIANRRRLGIDVESLAGFGRTDQAISPLIKSVHGRKGIGLLGLGKMLVHRVQGRSAAGKTRSSIPSGKLRSRTLNPWPAGSAPKLNGPYDELK